MAANTHLFATALNRPPVPPSARAERAHTARLRPPAQKTFAVLTTTGWDRIMQSMPRFGRAGALRFVGNECALPIGLSAIEFLLEKAAATVIPIRVLPDDDPPGDCGPDIRRHPKLRAIDYGGVVRQVAADGVELSVLLFDCNNNQIAELRSSRRQCVAWRALVEWTLLRTGQTGTP